MTATVLSNENPEAVQRFYAASMNPGAPEPAEAEAAPAVESVTKEKAATEGKGSEQEQAQDDPEAPEQPAGDKKVVSYRFTELTQRAKDAEAKVEAERKARVLAEQRAADLQAKYEPPKADPLGPKPKLEQFNNADEFSAALEDWTTDKVTHEREQKDRMDRLAHQWGENEKAAKAEIPDFETTIAAVADLTLPNEVRDAIMESEQGPWVLHHIAKNPDLISQIRAMKPEAQLRFIGKLEGKFEASRSGTPAATDIKSIAKPATAAATEVSRAPAPINPLRGSSTAVTDLPINAEGDFIGTHEQYRELRRARKIT